MPLPSPPSSSQALGERVVRALAVARDVAGARQGVLREVARWCGAPLAILWLLDEQSGLLRWAADWSDDDRTEPFRELSGRLTFAAGVGLPGAVLATLEPAFIERVADEPQFPRREPATDAGLHSAAAAPLIATEGAIGVLEVMTLAPRPILAGQLADLETAGRQLAMYLARVEAEERLLATEESSRSIVRAALDCVITMDHTGRILDFNPAAEATFGHRREDVLGDLLAERIIPPELREMHRRALASYVETGEATILNRRLELTGLRADGSTFPLELTVTRLASGEPPVFAGFIRDITERRAAELERDGLLADAISARARAEAAELRAAAARAATEAAGERLALLAEASERMLAIRDYGEAAARLEEIIVPGFADWCSVTLGEPQPRRATDRRIAKVARSDRTELLEPVTGDDLDRIAGDDDRLQGLRELAPRSVLTVPLRSARGVFGAITLAMTTPGRSFAPDDVRVAESLGVRAALAIENARLLGERSHIAETLQKSLLPPRLPAVPGLDLAARYRPAGEHNLVGGDFYDVFGSGDGVWTVLLGDVSGKGPGAAAVTALTRHTLRAAALRGATPVASLQLLNEALLAGQSRDPARFATVVFSRVCPGEEGATVTVSAGGHPPPLVLRAAGAIEQVRISGTLLGVMERVELSEVDVRLGPGDLMLLYTDGVTEVRTHEAGYGEDLLWRTLDRHRGEGAESVVAAIEQAVIDAEAGEPRDDIAIVAFRVLPR